MQSSQTLVLAVWAPDFQIENGDFEELRMCQFWLHSAVGGREAR